MGFQMATYTAVLLDSDGCETVSNELETMKDAKARAKYLLSDAFAAAIESNHADLNTRKVEVLDQSGECVWDEFRQVVGEP